MQKSREGKALIRLLSIPNKETGEFNEDPAALLRMGEYCLQDTRTTRELTKSIRMMTADEMTDWRLTNGLNERGAKIDIELAALAVQYADAERLAIAELLIEVTDGVITKHTQAVRARNWVLDRCDKTPALVAQMTVHKNGEKKMSMDKSIRANILLMSDTHELALPGDVINVIELIDQGNKSSVSKFQRMLELADPIDHRVRGAFVFAGAGQTQRFASRGLQLHNMRRDCFKPDEAIALKADMADGEVLDDVMNTLSKLLRPAIIPEPGKVFVVGDWAAIEGRCLPWLTKDPLAEKVLDVFRNDEDIYIYTADGMHLTLSPDDPLYRQIGKVATLALGFQGALGAFNVMSKAYGLLLPEAQVISIVKKWRKANPWAVKFWALCERSAIKAMANPGEYIDCGRCQFIFVPGLIDGTLIAVLPDGTMLQYPRARLEYVETQYGGKRQVTYMKASLTPKADAKEWPRAALYGGIIAENLTQGTAGALLRYALRRLKGEPATLHVHDEIVLEVFEYASAASAAMLRVVMEQAPKWAEGLPLKAVPVITERYGK
jgi:DNA polymerase